MFRLPQRALLSFRNPPEKLASSGAKLTSIWQHPEANPPAGASDVVPENWRAVFAENGLTEELTDSNSRHRHTPRILLDGADSIGAWGALAQVYLNIGSYWERWNQLHQPVLGFLPQKPFEIDDCREHSVYWNATSLRVPALRDYFLAASNGMPLLATKNAVTRLEPIIEADVLKTATNRNEDPKAGLARERALHVDLSKLKRGRQMFAQNCIVCHSSIQPESTEVTLFGARPQVDKSAPDPAAAEEDSGAIPKTNSNEGDSITPREKYLMRFAALAKRREQQRNAWTKSGEVWEHDPGQWLQDEDYQQWALDVVERPEFWQSNFLSIDYRMPISVVGTNSARAMGTNAMTGHLWEDFSSMSFRQLPSPGPISYFNPFAGKDGALETFEPRHETPEGAPAGGGGPGYYRVPTLVSIWATAPFLHNNSLGLFNNDPSVDGRLLAFDDAIRKMLWPKRRLESSSYNEATPERLAQDHGLIWRTPQETYLVVAARNVPVVGQKLPWISNLKSYVPWLKNVNPLWLPSAVLLLTGWVLMVVSNDDRRKKIGYLLLVAAAIYGLVSLLAREHPAWKAVAWITSLKPPGFLTTTLLAGGITLLLPWSRKWVRYVSYVSVVFSLGIGFVVYFNAGKLGDLRIGPIPKGTPVNLLANLNSEAEPALLKASISETIQGLAEIESRHLKPEVARDLLRSKVAPALMKVNKCPDFVMDKGHYFEWFDAMTDDDKDALIELLKTF